MQQSIRILAPLYKKLSALNSQPVRTFFSRRYLVPIVPWGLDSHIRHVQRQFEKIEREFNESFCMPLRNERLFPNFGRPSTPMTIYETESPGKYQVNVVVGEGVTPENIKVTLTDRVVKIEAKYEQTSEDGKSRISQEFMRQFTLPENVDPLQVKSLYTPEGILQIEAPLPPVENDATKSYKEIPINIKNTGK